MTGYIPAAARLGVDIKKAMAPGRQATSSFIFSFGRRVRIILYRRVTRVTGVEGVEGVLDAQLLPAGQFDSHTPPMPWRSRQVERCKAGKPAVVA